MKVSTEEIIDSQNRLFFRLLGAFFFIELSVIFFLFLAQAFGQDELESIHDAWKIFLGQRIFIDFFEHHHPFFYYLLVPIVAAFKENVMVMIAARMLIFLLFLLILVITYKVARNLYGKISAIISLVLLPATMIFIIRAIQIRPEVPQTLFGLLALLFLFFYFERNSLKYLILSSIFLAVSFLFLQIAVFFIFVILALLSFEVFSNRIKLRDLIFFLLAF
ncbi:MAG: glycosyltransferase family 39 protein, partial [Candidatus Omnitrophica bacterium]|nr:glycosyltransferase family 39 protein [Candidatus Omnitrophota bacterium]